MIAKLKFARYCRYREFAGHPPPGYGMWGGGGGPTGLSNSPTLSPIPGLTAKPGFGPQVVNLAHYVIFAVTGTPQQCQPIFVPPNSIVAIRAHNGTDAGNQHVVRVSSRPETLTGTGGYPITPDSEVSWPVDKVNQIWAVGNAGDGICVTVQRGRQS